MIETAGPALQEGAAQRVYLGILTQLEEGDIVPGQRLAEIEIASQFGVGRNAVREAMQQLATRGVIDLSRHRSPEIRKLDLAGTFGVLEVAELMIGLTARAAARAFDPVAHAAPLDAVMAGLATSQIDEDATAFSRARRQFYRALLAIGGHDELQRIFPAIGMPIVYAQYRSPRFRQIRIADYREIADAVRAGAPDEAEAAARRHVDHIRDVIAALSGRPR